MESLGRVCIWIIAAPCLVATAGACAANSHSGETPSANVIATTARLHRFEAQLEEIRAVLRIPGMAAVIINDDSVVWAKGFGFADVEGQILVTPATAFHIASLTKTFGATIVFQLMEEGKLQLDDRVARYVEDFPDTLVTIRHLLSHTSDGVPGTAYRYNGNRYDVLTKVIERATGKSFRVALAQRILDRVGMPSTVPGNDVLRVTDIDSAWLTPARAAAYDEALRPIAKPYRLYGTKVVPTPYPPDHIGAAAGIVSTVLDIARYDRAINQHLLVTKSSQDTAWTSYVTPSGRVLPHGLGWFVEPYEGMKLIWHFGDWPNSFSALLLKIPERSLSLYVFANSDALSEPPFYNRAGVEGSPIACTFLRIFVEEPKLNLAIDDPQWNVDSTQFASQLRTLRASSPAYNYSCDTYAHDAATSWLDEKRRGAHVAIAIAPASMLKYVGRYGRGTEGAAGFVVSSDSGKMMMNVPRFGKYELFAESPTMFFLEGMDLQFRFIADETGNYSSMEFINGTQRGVLRRQ